MKVDKKKLFEAIRDGKTELFKMTYSISNFDYSVTDMETSNIKIRMFSHSDEFQWVFNVTEKELPEVIEELKKVREELEKLGCILEE